jgi:hypothetical protein
MSSFSNGFTYGFRQGRAHEQLEREHVAEVNRPIPRDINPPEQTKKVQVRVLRAFYVAARPRLPGELVEVEAYMARGLVAMGKAEWPNGK